METSIISKAEKILRDFVNHIASTFEGKPFLEEVTKRLKFENQKDWATLCSLMDVLSDTELAKENFFKFNLSGPTKIQDYGEQYLRLYGITNAMYLQKSAIETLLELVKLPNKKSALERLNKSEIIKFRNIVGAHTVNYLEPNKKTNPYQFQRYFSHDGSIKTLDSENNFKDYDLKKLIEDFNDTAEDLLIQAIEKIINTSLKNQNGKIKPSFLSKVAALKEASENGFALWPDVNEELFVIKMKTD